MASTTPAAGAANSAAQPAKTRYRATRVFTLQNVAIWPGADVLMTAEEAQPHLAAGRVKVPKPVKPIARSK